MSDNCESFDCRHKDEEKILFSYYLGMMKGEISTLLLFGLDNFQDRLNFNIEERCSCIEQIIKNNDLDEEDIEEFNSLVHIFEKCHKKGN